MASRRRRGAPASRRTRRRRRGAARRCPAPSGSERRRQSVSLRKALGNFLMAGLKALRMRGWEKPLPPATPGRAGPFPPDVAFAGALAVALPPPLALSFSAGAWAAALALLFWAAAGAFLPLSPALLPLAPALGPVWTLFSLPEALALAAFALSPCFISNPRGTS